MDLEERRRRNRERARKYWAANREKIKAKKAAYFKKYPEKKRAKSRRDKLNYRLKHPEKWKQKRRELYRRRMERLALAEATLKALLAGQYAEGNQI